MRTVDISFYVAISATLRGSGDGVYCHRSSARLTKNKPSLDANEVPVRINLSLPISLFQRPSLEASISIPEDSVTPPEISADVQSGIAEAIRAATGFNVRLRVEAPEGGAA